MHKTAKVRVTISLPTFDSLERPGDMEGETFYAEIPTMRL
jgi:hypothetical protein